MKKQLYFIFLVILLNAVPPPGYRTSPMHQADMLTEAESLGAMPNNLTTILFIASGLGLALYAVKRAGRKSKTRKPVSKP